MAQDGNSINTDYNQPISYSSSNQSQAHIRSGVIYAMAAYISWGLVPIYFKTVANAQVKALEILAHRIVWSVILLLIMTWATGHWKSISAVFRSRSTLLTLALTAFLVGINWYTFIWAVEHNQILQSSLGYYINPLVNMLLGFLFLGERLRKWQVFSVCLAVVGVCWLTFAYGQFPWIALILAFSFGFYGLLRKKAHVEALAGLTIETLLMGPLAIGYLVYLGVNGTGQFATVSISRDALLAFAGVVTTLPLLWFAVGARRLRLTTMGFLQYFAPTGHFLLGVFVYNEQFKYYHAITFGCIWLALIIYSIDSYRQHRFTAKGKKKDQPPTAAEDVDLALAD